MSTEPRTPADTRMMGIVHQALQIGGQPGISGRTFALVAVLIVVSLGITIWYSIPGPDTRHDLRSPSGKALLQIGENCDETGCDRVMIYESAAPDGTRLRQGCPIDIPGTTLAVSST